MQNLPSCPLKLSDELHEPLRQLAEAWANSSSRPSPNAEIESKWTALLQSWIADESLPLFIRKAAFGRGKVIVHESGRKLIPADNSPAQWAFSLAVLGQCPTMDELHQLVKADRIPVAMILNAIEREHATYRYPLTKAENLNRVGWKLAHIDSIGLKQRGELETFEISKLETHFVRFMNPENMFLVPKAWAGLGEMAEMIEAIQAFRAKQNVI